MMQPARDAADAGLPRLVLLVSEYAYFLSHRRSLARAARGEYEVHVITRVRGTENAAVEPGLHVHPVTIGRGAGNPLREATLVATLTRLLARIRPVIVHNVSVRLAPSGSIAAAAAGVPGIVNAFTGLGYVFRGSGLVPLLLRSAVSPVLRAAARRPGTWSVCQNIDDLDYLRRRGLVQPERTLLIPGSGVDTDDYTPSPEPDGEPVVLFAGRLLLDKGIAEFVEAARILRTRGIAARFAAAGGPDPESSRNVETARLEAWRREGLVEWWGHCADMAAAYRRAHVVCLPSWHEGFPKVLLEAASSGRPVVASDIPGCRAAVTEGVNGLLAPVRDAGALADAIQRLIADPDLRATMGRNGRRMVEEHFSSTIINQQFLRLYLRIRDEAAAVSP